MAMRSHFREAVWARCSPSQVIPRDLQTGAIGQKLLAIWAPNLQQLGLESLMALSRPYPATLAEDLGSDLARVDWEDGDSYYRQVPWSWLRTSDGSGCPAVGEGCAAHSQCPFGALVRVVRGVPWLSGTYCFSCDTCSMAYGGLLGRHPTRFGVQVGKRAQGILLLASATLARHIAGAAVAPSTPACAYRTAARLPSEWPHA